MNKDQSAKCFGLAKASGTITYTAGSVKVEDAALQDAADEELARMSALQRFIWETEAKGGKVEEAWIDGEMVFPVTPNA